MTEPIKQPVRAVLSYQDIEEVESDSNLYYSA